MDNCDTCTELYDDVVRPHVLPCGHNFCETCMTKFISLERLVCPFCKKSHSATSAKDFPINYGMEFLLFELKKAKLESAITKSRSITRPSTFGSKLQVVFSDQTECLRNLIHKNEEIQSDLKLYEQFLTAREKKHESILDPILQLLQQNQEIIEKIKAEKISLQSTMQEGIEQNERATATLSETKDATSTAEIIKASEDVEICYDALNEWKEKVHKLPNISTITSSEKILGDSTAALYVVKQTNTGDEEPLTYGEPSVSVMSKVKLLTKETELKLSVFKTLWPLVRGLTDVYAVQIKGGIIRSARVSVLDNKTYLHYLRDCEPPANAYTVQHCDFIHILNPKSVVAFMDISWKGLIRGRVHISLSPDTPLARHFLTLCLGVRGPSYASSRFLDVIQRGSDSSEFILGGDYEKGNGLGGAPLLRNLNPNEDIYKRHHRPGIVWAPFREIDGADIAQFAITTGNGSGSLFAGVFGQVQRGLEILRAAVKLRNIGDVMVADCGVILPLPYEK